MSTTATSNNGDVTSHGEVKKMEEKNVPKAIIKNVDMSEEMQQMSVDIALEALSKFTVEKDIAAHVKKTMDQKFGPTWHAVVGQKYGSYVTHETKHFIYFCKPPKDAEVETNPCSHCFYDRSRSDCFPPMESLIPFIPCCNTKKIQKVTTTSTIFLPRSPINDTLFHPMQRTVMQQIVQR